MHHGGIAPQARGWYDLEWASARVVADVRVFQEVFETSGQPSRIHVPSGHTRVDFTVDGQFFRPSKLHRVLTAQQRETPGSWLTVVTTGFEVLATRVVELLPAMRDPRTSALVLSLDTPSGVVDLAAVHLTSVHIPLGPARQLAQLRDALSTSPRALIVGDCNLWRTVAGRVLGSDWSTPIRSGTWPAHRPAHHIDHIWVKGLSARGAVGPHLGSDHLPVKAEVF